MLNWPHIRHGLAYELRRLRQQGYALLFCKLLSRLVSWLLCLALLPLTIILHLVGFRRVTVFTDRIGHLALEPDCLLKEEALGLIPKRRWFILAPPGRVANHHLLRYWRARIPIYESRLTCFVLASMSRCCLMHHDVSGYILSARHAQAAYSIYSKWKDKAPLLKLTQEDEVWAKTSLHALGLPENAWFVCLHVREAGFSPIDEELHAHRNGSIENTRLAIEEIVRRGGWVIRIGDPTMKPLHEMPNVIDYAHSPLKSNRLDVVLCAKARFILGNTSGVALIGSIFGTPCAQANLIPVSTLWFNARDIGIPKLLWSKALERYLRLDEIMNSPVANFRYAALYEETHLRVDENSSEDLHELVSEMLDRLEGTFDNSLEDLKRQKYFQSLFHGQHYSFDSCAHIGARFLRRHVNLLPGNYEISQ